MKNSIVFVVGLIIGLVVGWKLGYEFVSAQISSHATILVDTLMTQWLTTGWQQLFDEYQWHAQGLLQDQKEQLQAELKKQAQQYIARQIDELFQ